jgi:membrane protein EpsK
LTILLAPRYGVIGIVLAGVLTLTLNYSIFIPIYTARIMHLPWWRYIQRLGIVSLAALGVTVISYLLNDVILLTSYFRLIMAGGMVSLIYLILVYFLGLTNTEKILLKNFFVSVCARK